jgi:Sporulation protein YtfJ (Spore_YtfJ)
MNGQTVPDELKQSIERRAAGLTGGLMESIAERLGQSAGVSAVYGQPIERDGVTIIPVARVSWGFGGGSGTGTGSEGGGSGEGGGGGVSASPLGFVEIRNGQAEFHPIVVRPPLWAIALVILASGLTASLALRALRRLFRD